MASPPSPSQRRPRTPRGRAKAVAEILAEEFPTYEVPLDHKSSFQLLAATILSAQCTDAMVNRVTPALFAKFPDAPAMATADIAELEELVRRTGFYRSKARSLSGMAKAITERFDGEVPGTMDALVTLPGVGRKTANVVLAQWFGVPGIAVDTHVLRVSQRLGLTQETDPVKVEYALGRLWPRRLWSDTSLRLIFHGRRTCTARSPACDRCPMAGFCPSAFTFNTTTRTSTAGRRRSRPSRPVG